MKDFVVPLYYFFNRKKRSAVVSTPQGTTWNLVRGGTRTDNLGAQFAGRTGWAMASGTPAEFTISAAGVISAVLPHLFTAPGTLTVTTDQGNIRVPTTIRDWFPSDDPNYRPGGFFSVARSHDGSANQLMLSIQVQGVNAYSNLLDGPVDISSGSDGYLNREAVRTAVSEITDGIIYATRLREQIAGHWAEDEDVANVRGAIGYVSDSEVTFLESPGGQVTMRGEWAVSDFNSDWTDSISSNGFEYGISSFTFDYLNNYSAFAVLMNRTPSVSSNDLAIGDTNAFPRLDYQGNNVYRMHSTGLKPDIDATSIANDWVALNWHSLLGTASTAAKGIRYYSLATESTDGAETVSQTPHNARGITIRADAYDFSEHMAYILSDADDATAFRAADVDEIYASNAAAIFGGVNIDYTD